MLGTLEKKLQYHPAITINEMNGASSGDNYIKSSQFARSFTWAVGVWSTQVSVSGWRHKHVFATQMFPVRAGESTC